MSYTMHFYVRIFLYIVPESSEVVETESEVFTRLSPGISLNGE